VWGGGERGGKCAREGGRKGKTVMDTLDVMDECTQGLVGRRGEDKQMREGIPPPIRYERTDGAMGSRSGNTDTEAAVHRSRGLASRANDRCSAASMRPAAIHVSRGE